MRWNAALACPIGLIVRTALADGNRLQGPAKAISDNTPIFQNRRIFLREINEPEPDQACQWLIKVIDCGQVFWTAFFDQIAFIDITSRIHQEPTEGAWVDFWLTEDLKASRNLVFTGWVLVNTDNSARFRNLQTKSQAKRYGLWKGRPQMPWQSKAVQ